MAIRQATQRGWFRAARRGKLLLTKKLPRALRRARWLWSWYVKKPAPLPSPCTTLRPNTRTTCGKHNIGAVIGYLRRRPSYGEYRMGSSLALTCGAFCCLRYAAIFAVLRGKAIALSYPAEPLDKIIPLLLRLLLPSHLLCAQRSCSRRRSSTSSKQTALSSGQIR